MRTEEEIRARADAIRAELEAKGKQPTHSRSLVLYNRLQGLLWALGDEAEDGMT